ncbi:MAG: hypothetical protein HND53_05830 [Proteobacteria bacterium]|nr:hypothetical protein [Pseudomonadota bacterium]NOG60002.1 hypothetical protein [Pseudomonadota bacterium]
MLRLILLAALSCSINVLAADEFNVNSTELYEALTSPPIKVSEGTPAEVRLKFNSYLSDIECSQKHSLFAAGFLGGLVSINNINTGSEIKRIQAHANKVEIAWISDNGNVLATTSGKDTARFWDIHTGKQLFSAEFEPRSYPVLFKSRYLLLFGSNLSVIDIETGKVQSDVIKSTGGKAVVNDKNNRLYLLYGNTIRVFNITIDQGILYFDQTHREKLKSHGREFHWLHLIASDNSLLVVSKRGEIIKLDSETFKGSSVIEPEVVEKITSFNATGKHFIFSGRPKTNASNRETRYTTSRDTIYAGSTKKGLTHVLNLFTKKDAYACFKNKKEPSAIVGTMTNIVSTPLEELK